MGSVVGERFVRGVRVAYENRVPFVCISASGGARMQEGVNSLFQMAKTTAVLQELAKARLPFVSILTDPTMGGVSASFAFVADVVIAEPGALIGFAGPRVIEQTVREKLPEGFQRAEFLLEKGAIDMIVDRRQLRDELAAAARAADGAQPRARVGCRVDVVTRPVTLRDRARRRSTAGSRISRRCTRKAIAHGARARARGARADGRGARLPGDHRRRHQRQGLDVRDARGDAALRPATAPACYTSPHLLRYNERVRIDGGAATDAALVAAFNAVEDARAPRACAAHLFRVRHARRVLALRARADSTAAILEVGLGGRLDAVNVVDADVAVVTSVDLDHLDYLGPTREDIGREKAGIFRAGRAAVCGDPRSAGDARRARARDRRAAAAHRPRLRLRRARGHAVATTAVPAGARYGLPHPALRGALPARATRRRRSRRSICLRDRLPCPPGAVRDGLVAVELPGRFQVLPGTADASCSTSRTIRTRRARSPTRSATMGYHPRTIAVFGMLADKDIAGVIAAVRARIDRWHVATLPGPRGASAASAARRARARRRRRERDPRVRRRRVGVRAARDEASEADRIVVFGSFLTVAAALAAAERRTHPSRHG